jgi:hypothetical protein
MMSIHRVEEEDGGNIAKALPIDEAPEDRLRDGWVIAISKAMV